MNLGRRYCLPGVPPLYPWGRGHDNEGTFATSLFPPNKGSAVLKSSSLPEQPQRTWLVSNPSLAAGACFYVLLIYAQASAQLHGQRHLRELWRASVHGSANLVVVPACAIQGHLCAPSFSMRA